ncbi:MAG TPA: zinc-binding dehydrogenase [Gemmataceae bacterium]|nr:zinc-binding dehydrogenase [Gemmataceae bacterium]
MIRAAVFDGPGRPFRFEELPRPVLDDGEALMRITLCAVCGSDLHTFAGRRGGPTPCVLGHEPVGVIEELRGDVSDTDGNRLAVGDRVVWSVAVSCGVCFFCDRGLRQKCEGVRKYGHEPHAPGSGPLGGLASHCRLLPGTAIVKVPAGLPDMVAALAGCAVATADAGIEDAGLNATVVVFGAGMLGLSACALAADASCTVIACDVSDSRLSLATRFGAAHTATPADVVELAKSLAAGRGADLALEASGSPAAVARSLDVLRVGGQASWVGTVSPTAPVPVDPEVVVRKCLSIRGFHNYRPRNLSRAVGFLAANHERFPFAELVAKSFPLDAADEAFRYAEAEKPVRVAVVC